MPKRKDSLLQVVTDEDILALFTPSGEKRPVCVGCFSEAVAIHEIIPRSRRLSDWDEPDNRVTLCEPCHSEVTNKGAVNRSAFLRKARIIALDMLGHRDEAVELERRWFDGRQEQNDSHI